MDISNSILSDPINSWIFSNFKGTNIYLVGGYLRDLLQGFISTDKDFALKGNIRQAALKIADQFDGTFIELKRDQVCRIVLKDNRIVDFCSLTGNIHENLLQRDFTINSLAWSPDEGLIDPAEHVSDVRKGLIKATRTKNLTDDPLRIIRAYRFSGQLNFSIEANTRKNLKANAKILSQVSPERITDELFKILNMDEAHKILTLCFRDNVLIKIIDIKYSLLKHNINLINKLDHLISDLNSKRKYDYSITNALITLNQEFSQSLKRSGFIRLSLLTMNEIYAEKYLRFMYLVFSNVIINKLNEVHRSYHMARGRITEKKFFRILKLSGNSVLEMSLILSLLRGNKAGRYIKRAEDFLNFKKTRLLNGNEIMSILRIDDGPKIGEIQDAIHEEQFAGLLSSKADARDWIISNFT